MPSNKPQSGYQPLGRFRLPTPKPLLQMSLLQEYPYVFLVAFFAAVALLGRAAGLSLWDAVILSAWLGSILFFGWQLWRYLKYRSNPEAVAREESALRALLNVKARQAGAVAHGKTAPRAPRTPRPKIAVVPRKPAQRVPIRKPGMNVKPQPQRDETPKT